MKMFRHTWTLAVAYAMFCSATVSAQGVAMSSGQPLPPKSYMSEGVFSLPIVISNRVRVNLTEVQLYTKTKPSESWKLSQTVPPTSEKFVFRAPSQGEYWFTVVTVDRQGNRHPSNLASEPPGLIVVFDNQAPDLNVVRLPDRPEGKCFNCRATDAVSGPVNTRVYYQTRDGIYRAMDKAAGGKNVYCVPKEAAFTGMLRIIATDMAGNTVSRETALEELGESKTKAIAKVPQQKRKSEQTVDSTPLQLPELPEPQQIQKIPALPPSISDGPTIGTMEKQNDIKQVKNATPVQIPLTGATPKDTAIEKTKSDVEKKPTGKQHLAKKDNLVGSLTPSLPSAVKRHLVNKPNIALKYEIEDQGPSGVGKVEVYLTYDKGQTWKRYGEDTDRDSPVDINLTTEGLVGIRLVVSNGRGFGGNAPRSGEAPDWWVELDVTPPRAELHEVRPGSDSDAGAFYISWTTTDKNARANDVQLFYSEKREGPWLPLAKGLPSTGTYRWEIPHDAGPRAFVRLVTSDDAGNETVTETSEGVTLDDLSRPRARVVGVMTMPSESN